MKQTSLNISSPRHVILAANSSWYIYNFRASTIKMLKNRGAQVIVVSPDLDYISEIEELGARLLQIDLDLYGINPISEIRTILEYREIYKNQPDLIFNFTPKVCIYSTLGACGSGSKVVNNISGLGSGLSKNGPVAWVFKFLMAIMIRCTDFFVFQNQDDCDRVRSLASIPEERFSLVPGSGVDLNRFKFSDLPDEGEKVFGFFARMIDEKGARMLVKVVAQLKKKYNLRLIMAGPLVPAKPGHITAAELASWQETGLIEYKGSVDDIVPLMESCHCIVLPTWYGEGTPKVLLEASAIGRPIITTRVPGAEGTVTKETGLLITPKLQDELAIAMESILELPQEDLREMGRAARARAVAMYDENIVINLYEKLFDEVCSENESPIVESSRN